MADNDKHLPVGERGTGAYTATTRGCFDVMERAKEMCFKALGEYPQTGAHFTFCDFGTADGGTSLPLLSSLVDYLLSKYSSMSIYYEDQPSNDFTSLFHRLQSRLKSPVDVESFLLRYPGRVFVFASGTSFYEQCFPDRSLDFGFSATAMHWLSHKPCHLDDTVHHSTLPSVNASFAKQARVDLDCILVLRAKELKPGASFVMVLFAINDKGEYLGHTTDLKANMFEVMNSIWRDFVERSVITQSEFDRMTFANYYRNRRELEEPFEREDCPFSLFSMSIDTIPCRYRSNWLSGKHYKNSEEFASDFVPTTRSWSESTFKSALDVSRSESERTRIIDAFFDAYEELVARDPDSHGMPYVMSFMTLRKK